MKNKLMQKALGSMLSFLLVTWFTIGSAFALDLTLVAEEATATMPDTTSVTMWGLRDLNDPNHAAGDWKIPVFTTSDAVLNINLENQLPPDTAELAKPTSLIIPGLRATETNAMVPTWTDGTTTPRGGDLTKRVRSLTREAANGGGTADYSWNLKPGTYLIQSGTHQALQVQMGLFAVLVVYPATPNQAYDDASTTFTTEHVLIYSEIDTALHAAVANNQYGSSPGPGIAYTSTMNFNPDYYLINGQPFGPGVAPINLLNENNVLLRFVNAGYETRVPVLQGQYVQLIAEDGNQLPYPQEVYSIELTAGKTKDALLVTTQSDLIAVYDGRFSLTSGGTSGGGLLTYLAVLPEGQVVSPNGGEDLVGLSVTPVQWAAVNGATRYMIRFSSNGGSTWTNVFSQDASLGTTYNWSVPNITSSNSMIRVAAYNGSVWLGADDSNGVFSITPAGSVLYPVGGESLNGLDTAVISWTPHVDATKYTIRLSLNGGGSWTNLVVQDAALPTTFNWSIPNNITTTQAVIRVVSYAGVWDWLGSKDSGQFSVTPTAP